MNPQLLDSAWQQLGEIVSIYSPSGQEQQVAQSMLNWFTSHEIETWIDQAGNIRARSGNGPTTILLAGHIDTVSPMLNFRQTESQIFGRGSVDAKSPLMAMAAATVELSNSRQVSIEFAGLVGEEADSRGARYLATEELNIDAMIIGEPSNTNGVTLGYKGRVLVEVDYVGGYGHSGYPLPFPAERMSSDWQALLQTFNNSENEAGVAFDSVRLTRVVPLGEDCLDLRANFDIRLAMDSSLQEVEQILANHFANQPMRIVDSCSPTSITSRSNLVRAMRVAIRQQDLKPQLFNKTGTADLNLLVPAFAVEGIAYGPGDSSLDHTPDEHISLSDFETSVQILCNGLNNYSGFVN